MKIKHPKIPQSAMMEVKSFIHSLEETDDILESLYGAIDFMKQKYESLKNDPNTNNEVLINLNKKLQAFVNEFLLRQEEREAQTSIDRTNQEISTKTNNALGFKTPSVAA